MRHSRFLLLCFLSVMALLGVEAFPDRSTAKHLAILAAIVWVPLIWWLATRQGAPKDPQK